MFFLFDDVLVSFLFRLLSFFFNQGTPLSWGHVPRHHSRLSFPNFFHLHFPFSPFQLFDRSGLAPVPAEIGTVQFTGLT